MAAKFSYLAALAPSAKLFMTLDRFNPKQVIIFSRDEMKQWEMAQQFSNDMRVKFVIGDVGTKNN